MANTFEWRTGALVALVLLLSLGFAQSASASRYVAMGDSYSSGTGTKNPDLDQPCDRSSQAYGPLIKSALGAESSFRFSACTGARTPNILNTSQNGNPPQADTLGADTLDTTISIGGNDAGFGDVLLQCGYPMVSCDGDIDTAQAYMTNTLPGVLDSVYDRIRAKAPNARVGVIGYPRLFPADGDDCSAATFFSAGEIARLNQTADMLADVTRSRARAHGFAFIDSRPAFLGHAWCENEWINGLSNPTSASYHPNPSGQQGFAGITRAAMLAAPAPSFARGANGRIVFASTRDGNSEIYAMGGDGSHAVNLTANAAADEAPAVSPDGMRIAFASNRGGAGTGFDIYTMNWDGTGVQRLTSAAGDDYDPAWSPNGRQLVFRSDRDGDNEIYKINADGTALWDGSQIQKLTENTVSDFLPSFSPDGAEIVFQRYSAAAGNEVYKMNADGQGQINLTANEATVNDGGPRFSPDGSQIAFHSNRDGDFEIYTMAATGGTATKRTSNSVDDKNATWSPNGTQIAFQSNRDGADRIYTMTASGGSQTRRSNGGGSDGGPSWQADGRAPESTISSGPPSQSNQSNATFSFVSDELGSTFECRLDGSAWAPCASPFSTGSIADGDHGFQVRATDPSGNVEASPSVWEFAVDTQAKLTHLTGPSGPITDSEPEFTFASEHPDITFECRLTAGGVAGAWSPCVSPWQPDDSLPDGAYRFEVRATDGVGNVEDPPQRSDFTVDTVAPAATVSAGPEAIGNDPSPTFEIAVDEPGVSLECLLASGDDPGSWQPCESPYRPAQPLADGEWSFSVRATDLAGNVGPVSPATEFALDTVAPASEIVAGPGARHGSSDVEFEFSSADPSARFECRLDTLDDADWQHCDSPLERTGLKHGQHEFQVRAIDPAGNVQAVPTRHPFGVDTSPNYTVTQWPSNPSSSNRPVFGFNSDDPGAFFTCSLDGGEWEECATPYDPTLGGPGLDDGQHRMEIKGTDSFGDVTAVAAIEWVVDHAPPVATIVSGPPALDSSSTAVFTIDPGRSGVALMCKIDGWNWAPCPGVDDGEGPFEVRFEGLLDAAHQLKVRSDGPISGPGPVATHEWTVDATPPPVSLTAGPRGRTTADQGRFEFRSDDPEATFECRVDEAAFAPCASPHDVSGLADGTHRFTVRASDEAGNVSALVNRDWTVDTTGPEVSLTEVPADGSEPGRVEFRFASDDPTAVFSCRLDGGEWRPCGSPHPVEITAGAHRFEVEASDDLGNRGEPAVHSWNAVTRAVRPSIQISRRVRANRPTVAVATVRCPTSCRIEAPRKVKVTGRGLSVRAPLVVPRRVTGRATVSVRLSASLRRALARRPGRLRLQIKAVSAAGPTRALGQVQLRR